MDIIKELEKKAKEVAEMVAREVADEMHEKYYDIIDDFYADYDPRMYTNRGQTKYLALLPQIVENAGNRYIGGIEIDPSRIGYYQSIYDWNADANWVFKRVWTEGIHGWKPWEFPYTWMGYIPQPSQMSPTPEQEMDEYFFELCSGLDSRVASAIQKVF